MLHLGSLFPLILYKEAFMGKSHRRANARGAIGLDVSVERGADGFAN